MTWKEAQLSLQVLAEEKMGAPARQGMLLEKAKEDAAAAAVVAALGGPNGTG